MQLSGVTELEVGSEREALDAMSRGGKNRATFFTNSNEHSSRSHRQDTDTREDTRENTRTGWTEREAKGGQRERERPGGSGG